MVPLRERGRYGGRHEVADCKRDIPVSAGAGIEIECANPSNGTLRMRSIQAQRGCSRKCERRTIMFQEHDTKRLDKLKRVERLEEPTVENKTEEVRTLAVLRNCWH